MLTHVCSLGISIIIVIIIIIIIITVLLLLFQVWLCDADTRTLFWHCQGFGFRLTILTEFFECFLRTSTVEPRFINKGPRDWQNLFAITRFCLIKVLFHIFYCYWGKENRLRKRNSSHPKSSSPTCPYTFTLIIIQGCD